MSFACKTHGRFRLEPSRSRHGRHACFLHPPQRDSDQLNLEQFDQFILQAKGSSIVEGSCMQLRGQANGAVKHGTQEQKNGTGAVTEKRGFMRPAADYLRADSASIESLGILFEPSSCIEFWWIWRCYAMIGVFVDRNNMLFICSPWHLWLLYVGHVSMDMGGAPDITCPAIMWNAATWSVPLRNATQEINS